MNDTIIQALIQDVVGPATLVLLAGGGWFVRNYLKVIKAEVKNDHKSNLREDVDSANEKIETLSANFDNFSKLLADHAQSDYRIATAVERIESSTQAVHRRMDRFETRLDAHLDKRKE